MIELTPEQILEEYRQAVLCLENAVAVNASDFSACSERVEASAKPILEALAAQAAAVKKLEEPIKLIDLAALNKSMREHMKEDEGWTFHLPHFPPLGQKRIDKCNYCWEPKAKHREDGRCPIKGCTLSGPPKKDKV